VLIIAPAAQCLTYWWNLQ